MDVMAHIGSCYSTAEPYISKVGLIIVGVYIVSQLLTTFSVPFKRYAYLYTVRFLIGRQESNEKEGVVYVFTFPRHNTRQMLNLSPFGIKLESWLRLNNVPHKVVETHHFSSTTQQIPYIHHNGREVADTLIIIDYVIDAFGLDVTEGLTSEQRGASRALIRMMDECFSITHFLFRYHIMADDFSRIFRPLRSRWLSWLLMRQIGSGMAHKAAYMGVGRHPTETVADVSRDDIRAVSRYLGDKAFLMGDQPKLVDCAVFGHLSPFVYPDVPYPQKDILDAECANLRPYLDRVKARLWPDWHLLVNEGKFEH